METRYREVKSSERLPVESDWYITSVGKVWYMAKYWYRHANPTEENLINPKWWLEEIPPEAEEQQSQVGEWDKVLKTLPQLPQTQEALNDQLRKLHVIANKFGLYDAADYCNISNPTPKKVPTDKDIEDWYNQGRDPVTPEFWQEAPYCTHGDRLEEIKEALRHFSLLPDTIQNGDGSKYFDKALSNTSDESKERVAKAADEIEAKERYEEAVKNLPNIILEISVVAQIHTALKIASGYTPD